MSSTWLTGPPSVVIGALFFALQGLVYLWVTVAGLFGGRVETATFEDLANASSFDEFQRAAAELERRHRLDEWRRTPKSKGYDYKLIQHRLAMLRRAPDKDMQALMWTVRSGLLRNLGGICEPVLYSRSPLGTKTLVHDYTDAVVRAVGRIAAAEPGQGLDAQAKSDFFTYSRAAYGSTALLLQGGASFGLCHLGVVKALYEQQLLPRIISGSSIGALIAALVCVNSDADIARVVQPDGINLQAFSRTDARGTIRRKVVRLLKRGYLMDVKVLESCVRNNVGDYTFEDAFRKTGRVLNIVVSSKRQNEVPRLLNYITAPNVLIWSAACASAAFVNLYDHVNLLAKDKNGAIVHWGPSSIKWSDATFEHESPEMRLAELFNVNHFILSQANPILAPVTARSLQEDASLRQRLVTVIVNEARFRILQLCRLGLMPRLLYALLDQKFLGNVTITPNVGFKDFRHLFSNPTSETVNYWMKKGEQATWPYLAYIRNRCAIEFALDKAFFAIKARAPQF